MKLFTHSKDHDGRACGALLTRKFPEARLIPYNYFYDPKYTICTVEPGEAVIFGDITPTAPNLDILLSITENITIFDHHSGSLRELEQRKLTFPGIMTNDGLGACALIWMWYYPDQELPRGIRWVAEYDSWERTPENMYFHYGLSSLNTLPTNPIWDKIISDNPVVIENIINQGKKILQYLTPRYKRLVNSYAIEGTIGEYSCLFLNQGAVDSSVFDSVTEPYDIYVRAILGKNLKWLVSITTNSDTIDVSKIAEQYGGGGHQKSAGFVVKELSEFVQLQEGKRSEKKFV